MGRKRIITCQGSIQLVAALAALNYRSNEQTQFQYEYDDFLVIYDLYAPPGQTAEFASFVEKMAHRIWKWRKIVYITPEQMNQAAASLTNAPRKTVFDFVYDVVGSAKTEEIFLCRNWQFGNKLLINAYRRAEKICYGDSIGIYFSEAYFGLAASANNGASDLSWRRKLGTLKNRLVAGLKSIKALEEIGFDAGYFLLPDILGEVPPMKTVLVNEQYYLDIFQKLGSLLDDEFVTSIRARISGRPVVVLMTSNFAEAERMTSENEIAAYKEFLENLECDEESVLIIKPHPRESEAKVHKLKSVLGDLFPEPILLADPNLFFVPFEIFLLRAVLSESTRVPQDLKIVTFSTACLAPAVLFDVRPIVGFGADLVNKYFYEDHAAGRNRHELDLQQAVSRLTERVPLTIA